MTALVHEKTKLTPCAVEQPAEPAHDLDYLTNFERKFRKQGKEIYRAMFRHEPRASADSAEPGNSRKI